MRYSGTLHRRVVHLERVQKPSTTGKLQDVQHAALAMISCEDRKLLEELKGTLPRDGRTSLEHAVAVDRFNEAFVDALVAAGSGTAMAQINRNSEPVHFSDRLTPKYTQARIRGFEATISVQCAIVVRQLGDTTPKSLNIFTRARSLPNIDVR